MKKCDHCEKEAHVTFDVDRGTDEPRYVGGLCKDHDTEENQKAIIDRWGQMC